MSPPQVSCNAISCPPHIEIQDHARSDITISHLDEVFDFVGSSENEQKDCIITSTSAIDDDAAGSSNVEFKDESNRYNSDSCCSIDSTDIEIQYLLCANGDEQEQGFILPSWQHELGNESFILGNAAADFFSSETETTKLLELCASDCCFGRGGGGVDAFAYDEWLAEYLSGDFLIDCCDEMEIPTARGTEI